MKKKTTPKEKTLQERLVYIQQNLRAPKNQFNKFGNYNYRNCEDILEALKPLLGNCVVLLEDKIVRKGDRYYVKATATLSSNSSDAIFSAERISCSAYARETESKKGMDASQITGSASSYARKYALNGLFAIDDTQDADTLSPEENEREKAIDNWQPKSKVGKASEKQRKMIFAVAKEKGYKTETIMEAAKKQFNLESFNDISSLQAKKVIDGLLKKPNK